MTFHPCGNIFPLLEGDALLSLAEDIRVKGLRDPILLDPDGRILDGRNRFRCCELTGTEPDTKHGTAKVRGWVSL